MDLAGRVAVNGATIASPAVVVTPADQVTVDGKLLPEMRARRGFGGINKPPGLVTTHATRKAGRRCSSACRRSWGG